MLSHIEVLEKPDENYWMHTAYLIPDTPGATMAPDAKGVKMVPINQMVPHSFITNLHDNATVQLGVPTEVRGIALGGETGRASGALVAWRCGARTKASLRRFLKGTATCACAAATAAAEWRSRCSTEPVQSMGKLKRSVRK